MQAIREVGIARIGRFLWTSLLLSVFRRAWLPPIRAMLLGLYGARVGRDTIIHRVSFINADRAGFRALTIGNQCFLGDEVLIDLAAAVHLDDHVTLAVRSQILTHLNVGYRDHPLQTRFPSETKGVTVGRGAFVGAGSIVLAGVSIGAEVFVAAGSLVTRDVAAGTLVGGVPARPLPKGPR